MIDFTSNQWWNHDDYVLEDPTEPLCPSDTDLWGPYGPALVRLWSNGTTSKGWGRNEFMREYRRYSFAMNKILKGYRESRWFFAWVMRSCKIVCIDIDGKNGGLEHVSELGLLPPTTAEISKSGNGYHLFYRNDDTWDEEEGFSSYRDHIGIVEGVDIRGVGCVYHYPTQRWNDRPLADLPKHLEERLKHKKRAIESETINIKKTLGLDEEEILMMQHDLIEELNKPIPQGRRNTSLFAIGSKLHAAQIENWDELILARAEELGLDSQEAEKIVFNIRTYA